MAASTVPAGSGSGPRHDTGRIELGGCHTTALQHRRGRLTAQAPECRAGSPLKRTAVLLVRILKRSTIYSTNTTDTTSGRASECFSLLLLLLLWLLLLLRCVCVEYVLNRPAV